MQYYQLIRNMSNFNLRLQVVTKAQGASVSEAARFYGTTRKTVRKWVRRHEKYGLDGLKDLRRVPKHIPHKLKAEDESRIIELRQKHPRWGPQRLIDIYHVKGSYGAVARIIRQHKLVKPKRRRWRKRKDLSELKKKMFFFENSQIDTKDLSDIYQYWPYMRNLKLPRYEYTLRELSTGNCFYAYADENNSTYASLFARYVIEHLKSYGIHTARIRWQTDNGSEFIGSVRKRINRLSAFEKEIAANDIEHGRIPPRSSYLQGDVETFRRIIEDELYDIEGYDNGIEFLGKAYAYHLYFNYIRKNRYRDHKSPVEILRERFPGIDEGVLNLPPIRLETLLEPCYKERGKSGYHVPISAKMKKIKVSKREQEVLEIKEKFMSVDTRPLDSKHRITLGGRLYKLFMSKMKIDSYRVFVGKDGDILLRPAVSIPSSEAWVYRNPEVIGKIRNGLEEAGEGKTEKVDDLEEFLDNL